MSLGYLLQTLNACHTNNLMHSYTLIYVLKMNLDAINTNYRVKKEKLMQKDAFAVDISFQKA